MIEHFDVLIVGAGLSGIGAAYHLQVEHPGKRYSILESRKELGGTWSLFRYPGIRSDSDMYTFGYTFRPWADPKAIADGDSILRYLRETASDYGIDRNIRFQHRVISANWSSERSTWLVDVQIGTEGQSVQYSSHFLFICGGYYDYANGYEPEIPGATLFRGQIVHPQNWPTNLDVANKRIVVIGSGATAVTLVPALAEQAEHVTMLQRSPSYVAAMSSSDSIARFVRRYLPKSISYRVVRLKNVLVSAVFFQLSRSFPRFVKRALRNAQAKQLPEGYDIDKHFSPRYKPWDQRVCIAPDGDLFKVISSTRASIETDLIETFVDSGIRLKSGKTLPADIVVTATGLKLKALGGIQFIADGETLDIGKTYVYNGVMLGNVPNLAFTVGYTNASWTLRSDLSSAFVCRVLKFMDRKGYRVVVPKADAEQLGPPQPLLSFTSGYVQRSLAEFPKQGRRAPWKLCQHYFLDLFNLKFRAINDGALKFKK